MLRCSTGTGALLPERCHRTGETGPGTSLHVITDQRTRRAVGGKPGITNIPPLPAVPPVTVAPYGRRLPTPPLSSLDLPREKKGVTVSPVQTVESVPSGVVRPAIRGVGRSVGIMWTTSTGCGWIPAPADSPTGHPPFGRCCSTGLHELSTVGPVATRFQRLCRGSPNYIFEITQLWTTPVDNFPTGQGTSRRQKGRHPCQGCLPLRSESRLLRPPACLHYSRELLDLIVGVMLLGHLLPDLPVRVHDRGVIFPAEARTDLG